MSFDVLVVRWLGGSRRSTGKPQFRFCGRSKASARETPVCCFASTPPDFSNNSNTFTRASSFLPGSNHLFSIDFHLDLTVYLAHKLYEEVPGSISISMDMGSFRRPHSINST